MTSMSSTNDGSDLNEGDIVSQIQQRILKIKENLCESGKALDECREGQEKFFTNYYNLKEIMGKLESMKQQLGQENPEVRRLQQLHTTESNVVKTDYLTLINRRNELSDGYSKLYEMYQDIQGEVLNHLIIWKREQQLAGNGHQLDMNQLEILQDLCSRLAETIWSMRQQLKQLIGLKEKIADPQVKPNDQEMLNNITELLRKLVVETFVVEKQPPQVMKTNTKFLSKVRLLVGGVLNPMAAPAVTVSIISEEQANQLEYDQKDKVNSGDILNGSGRNMESQNTTKELSVEFRNLQLKKIKRPEKQANKGVMEEKFSIVFWTEFVMGEGELKFQLWTLSTPVVVIVHGNQEPQALATVTWDNAFAESMRSPFVVTDKVTWGQMGEALNMKWTSACGSPLTEENLHYLACKAFRNNTLPKNMEEVNKFHLSWSLFCKEDLPGRDFTFWEWFLKILVLTQCHLASLWKEGLVKGCISKESAESMLKDKPAGTFLLRFSDSLLGGVTIAYAGQPGFSVTMVAPFTSNHLRQRCMANMICDLPELTMMYPNKPKDELKIFITATTGPPSKEPNGYVGREPVCKLDNNQDEEMFPIGQQSISTEIGEMDIDLGEIPDITDIDINTIFQIVDQNGPIQF